MEKLITELKNPNTENLDMLTVMDIKGNEQRRWKCDSGNKKIFTRAWKSNKYLYK